MDKNTLRKEILEKRKLLSPIELIHKSSQITELFFHSEFYHKSKYLMTYIDFRNEAKTEDLIRKSIKDGKNVIIPISVPETRGLILSKLNDYDNELDKGTYGILEPKEEFIRPISPELVDLILIPGVAFDKRGFRIGYGGGYYDRFLKKIDPSIPRIALAFNLQIIEKVAEGRFDMPVDYIITENEVIKCKLK